MAATRSLATLAAALSLAAGGPVRADVYLVVGAASAVRSLSQKEAIDLYMGRHRALPDGELATVLDLPRDNALRNRFYESLTGLSLAQVNSYWARLMFSGQTRPPKVLASEATIANEVKRDPNAIGYLGHEPADRSLRTVLVLKARD